MKFHWDVLPPAISIAGSYLLGIAAWNYGASFVYWINPALSQAVASAPPAGISGADLIANLLTISALVISGCFVYICLPPDRVELRIANHVRTSFVTGQVDEVVFLEYCAVTHVSEQTSYCQICNAFLEPLTGLGGWKGMQPDLLKSVFGENDTKRIQRVVDQHIDALWLAMLAGSLGIAMLFGAASLAMRYLALRTGFYSSFEFACICTLACLNLCTALCAVWLVFSVSGAESIVIHKLVSMTKDVKTVVNDYSLKKMNNKLDNIGSQTA